MPAIFLLWDCFNHTLFFVTLPRLFFTLSKKHSRSMIMIQGFGYLIRSGIQNANRSHPGQKNISNETIYQKTNDVIGHLCSLLALLNGEGTLSKCTRVLFLVRIDWHVNSVKVISLDWCNSGSEFLVIGHIFLISNSSATKYAPSLFKCTNYCLGGIGRFISAAF